MLSKRLLGSCWLALIAVAVAALTVWAGASWVAVQRQHAKQAQCRGRLSQIALALKNYRIDKGGYPPLCTRDERGRLMHSWRVLLLPYFECQQYFAQYDLSEPWSSPKNMAWSRSLPPYVSDLFKSPADFAGGDDWAGFVAIESRNNADCGQQLTLHPDAPDSAIIILTEIHNSGIYWTEPRDLPLDQALSGLVRLCPNTGLVNFVTAGGEVGTLSSSAITFRNSEIDLLHRRLSGTLPVTVGQR